MKTAENIRKTQDEEAAQVLSLYTKAFPEEDLQGLVRQLLARKKDVLSLGFEDEEQLIGHVFFTLFPEEKDQENIGALLGPLCVDPDHQKRGIGSSLISTGFDRLQKAGIRQVFVLGDPNYYSRHGFTTENKVKPAHDLPQQWKTAWQSCTLGNANALPCDKCLLPEPWMDKSLWLP